MTAVIAEASAGGVSGLGYTYAAAEAVGLINTTLAEVPPICGATRRDHGALNQSVLARE